MKKIKIISTVPNGVVVNINKYPKPFIQFNDNSGTVITLYSAEDYQAYLEYKKDSK